jgi:hypothetical protein
VELDVAESGEAEQLLESELRAVQEITSYGDTYFPQICKWERAHLGEGGGIAWTPWMSKASMCLVR